MSSCVSAISSGEALKLSIIIIVIIIIIIIVISTSLVVNVVILYSVVCAHEINTYMYVTLQMQMTLFPIGITVWFWLLTVVVPTVLSA